MPRSIGPKVMVFELFVEVFLQTDGTTSFTYTEADIPDLEDLGPYIESMYVLSVTRTRTTNHAWNVAITGSNTGRTYNTPVTIISSDVAANGEATHGLYSTPATYSWRRLKAMVGCRNSTGAARESAQVSAWLVVILRS